MFLTDCAAYENKTLTRNDTEPAMPPELKARLARLAPTMAEDAAGVAALTVMLVVGLHLPLLF